MPTGINNLSYQMEPINLRVGVHVRMRKTLNKGTVKKVDKSEQNGRYCGDDERDVSKPKI